MSTFGDMQECAYDIIKGHSEQHYPKDPPLLIIFGGGGTGKSYLINVLKNLLQLSCAVTATTAKAAFSIHGCTIYSALTLPVNANGNKDLTGQSLRLHNTLQEASSIIIVHFTVVCLVAKPLNRSEAKGDHVMIQTLLLLKCKLICYHAN